MGLYARARHDLRAALQDMLPEMDDKGVVLESPRDSAHGDLATNAAMVLARRNGQVPAQFAESLKEKLESFPEFSNVQVAAPGFVNVLLRDTVLYRHMFEISDDANFGSVDISQGIKALVEYVSINPTGPIHVGHGRNAVFGDAIANVLEKAGYPVWREYLVNDAGGQIRVLVKSLHARYLQLLGEDVQVPENGYPGEYLVDIARDLLVRDGEKWKDIRDEEALLVGLRQFAVDACMSMIQKDIETLGIKFDRYFSEYGMHQTDAMKEVVASLRDKGYVYEGVLPPPKGKEVKDYTPVELTLFKATEFGFPEDQAIYKRNGEPTYFGQDIAYHFDKLQRGYELLVTVLGADQAGSFKPLEKVVEILAQKPGVYHPVPYEMVKVVRDGVPVKLSKRAGNIVALKDVLEEVGTDAFRFMMLSVKPTTPLVFDLAKAVEKSMDNPVFYVQYAHARLASVWRQEGAKALQFDAELPQDWRFEGEARAVMVALMRYPLVIEQAARALEPHRLVVYAQELAAAVHKWYAAERWLDEKDPTGSAIRLAIARAAQSVLKDVLRLCGVSAPESM